jgi:hypothetical protein
MHDQPHHALAHRGRRRHALLLIGTVAFAGLFVALHAFLSTGTLATRVPDWVKLSGAIPVLIALHPILALLHPGLVLLISLGAGIIGLYKRHLRTPVACGTDGGSPNSK